MNNYLFQGKNHLSDKEKKLSTDSLKRISTPDILVGQERPHSRNLEGEGERRRKREGLERKNKNRIIHVCIQAHVNMEAVSYTHTTDTREAAVLVVTPTPPYPQPHSARLVPVRAVSTTSASTPRDPIALEHHRTYLCHLYWSQFCVL